ncbi:adenosylcobinamide-GDP ribazoletransferase [Pyramidobacter sp.]|uniref:adenosylcobinamide-GDP ribazoletransferase n=1 Tax=Pyramidobacter sp. TaxID=1943581 RepID=UPI002600B9C9|nr:adenosylcobinamide-GDP ribazoletransferase [Pyramidobacter sp.]MCI7404458.1 adenosylcobinamide-GDP ribazoletransferase [Pyramidobacter sp.]MDY3211794.1 adenosylcobinamide-GDP ribazoletransferase [Pyramidobacter sp.]
MDCLKPLWIALSTYSAIPVPQCGWDEKSLARSFCFLPAVGLLIGAAQGVWLWLCWFAGFNLLLRSAVAVAVPLLVSGGIHMDGFCDTMDALASHQPPRRCLEIMKDSRAGAFAIIYCGVYLVLDLGLVSEAAGLPGVFCLIFTMSRAVSVLSVLSRKNARGGGMLAQFQQPAQTLLVRRCAWGWIAVCAVVMDFCDLYAGTGALLGAVAAWFAYHSMAERRFGGITGDTSGFFVQTLELAMLAGMALGQAAEIARFALCGSF